MRRMKKLLMTLALLAAGGFLASGQIARWRIRPNYDDMFVAAGTDLIVTDSLGIQTNLWTQDGVCLVRTNNDIHAFRDGYAVSTKRENATFLGFYKLDGSFIPVKDGTYLIAHAYPYLSGQHLLVKEPVFHNYRFVDQNGDLGNQVFVKAFPFFNGYASCQYFANPEKPKDLVSCLINEDMYSIPFSFNGKLIPTGDVEFISSVNDEDIGVVVAKKKVYLFHGEDQTLTAMGPTDDNTVAKEQAKLYSDFAQAFLRDSDTTWVLGAKCGKNGYVRLHFDSMMRPESIEYVDQVKVFEKYVPVPRQLKSPLRATSEGGKYGLVWDGQEQLPPQFDEFPGCFDDKAMVMLSGKYGLLQLMPEEHFQLSLYKGKDIPFKHQTFETNIRLDLPSFIPAETASLEVDPASGCEIDRTSGETKNTQFGNYVQYDCVLRIPNSLPDEETIELEYPSQVKYQGLASPVIPVKARAWHYKYFVVDVLDSETVMDKGTLSFTFNINAERAQGEDIYPTAVSIQADSLNFTLEKYSETRYKCRVQNLQEGLNNIVVQVIEQGCPPVAFPFEIFYTKPVARSKNHPEVEEEVVIKKKESRPVKKPAPRVEM